MGKRQGRPTTYNEDMAKQLVNVLATGVSKQVAANYVGVKYETFLKWLERKPEFAEECRKASAKKSVMAHKAEHDLLLNEDPKAVQAYLKRELIKDKNKRMERLRREEVALKKEELKLKSCDIKEVISLPERLEKWTEEMDKAFHGISDDKQ